MPAPPPPALSCTIRREVTKAAAPPDTSTRSSFPVKHTPNFISFIRLKPAIAGTAIKKANSAATGRETPKSRAPAIAAPERDVPGTMESA